MKTKLLRLTALVALSSAAALAHAQDAEKVLRMVPQADLKVLDPIWTTAFVTRDHGYMIYDTLFGVDEQGKVKPQMVDTYSADADGLNWTLTLREGLRFHDGQPVTAEDVIQSLKRWGQRDNLGQKMFAALETIDASDAKTIKLQFKQPFGMVLEALAKPSSNPPFIMPKKVAETPAGEQIADTTGSGPYIFKADEFRPGEKVVYTKNPQYVPRAEAPSGTTGGKHVYVDRVEWLIIKDAQTQANALVNGEIDMVSWVPAGQYAALKANPQIELLAPVPKGMYAMHLNHHVPPFDNPKIAQAAILTLNQEALMRAQMINQDLYNPCTSIYPCGSAYDSGNTGYFTGKPQFEKAKQLLKEAGYDGTPVVLMNPSDFTLLNKFPPVLAQLLKQGGFNVDMQSLDWPSLVARRAKKDLPKDGGWNIFITGWGASDTMNPLYFAPMTGNGEKGWFGWAVDDKLEQLKSEFLATMDEAKRKDLAQQIQTQVFETGLYGPLGESQNYSAVRKGVVSGLVNAPISVFWNIKKHH
ncbi:MAG TPA: ABC transporter substrate-binding protein [Pusillimonas sp.]|uniref:ABC transporter substrate-binding protein n=1 Tax=Pusillimonas sp. TaxID=3040095 RepID=UPI002C85C1AF|nr:ABC transporter substrate-binding protein [Pusillimonas sp.]HUH88646.1 ABC transporter substrate-binding protein [Pusillimonas sp.]